MRAGGAVALFCLLLASGGCRLSGEPRFVRQRPPRKVETKVTVRSIPSGAEVTLGGRYLGETPLLVPIRYRCDIRIFEQKKSLPYPHTETREIRSYPRNRFTFELYKVGYERAQRVIELHGEEERGIEVRLRPRPDR